VKKLSTKICKNHIVKMTKITENSHVIEKIYKKNEKTLAKLSEL
jgi:hypothetical protein